MLWNSKWFPGTNLQDINLDWILKKVSALRGGTAGQYLYKKSDKDFDFGWKTGGGGGGGTSDYLELDNKPSINNIELVGNKTAADLGLAASSDIPEIPVQSVNGKTGVVDLSASDVGAYVKPPTGIPKTDLANDVQTSLDKADSALQAVPSTYRTAAAQDAIDAAQDAQIESISRRNLLDNWYFVGGGSQRGYGTFPINQRGQTSYTTAGYGIDRWKATSASMTCTVNRGGMLVKATAASQQWYQILSNQSELAGKRVTLSALTASNILIQTTVDIPSTLPSDTQTIGSGSSNMNGYALYVRTMGDKLSAVVYAGSNFSSTGIALAAVKLEIGSNQTLAHQENGAWVLNEIPDYGDELEKCRRYFRVLESSIGDGNGQYFVAARGYSDAAYINVAVEPPMMANIVPSLPDGIQGAAIDGAGTSANLSGIQDASSNKNFGIRAASNLARTPIAVYLNKRIYLSAES